MLAFGILGYVMRRFGFSVVPLALGLILGDIMENTLKQSMLIFNQDLTMFLNRPIALVFFACAFLGASSSYLFDYINRRRDAAKAAREVAPE